MGCPSEGCIGYELSANLDFDTNGSGDADAGDAYWNDGGGWDPIGDGDFGFNATFDGNGYTISKPVHTPAYAVVCWPHWEPGCGQRRRQ